MQLKGKHAFVTGAGKRLGRAIAETLLANGVHLSAHYRKSQSEVEDLKRKVASQQLRVETVAADLGDTASLIKAVQQSQKALGNIDILINCASDFYPTPALECTEEQWDHFQTVNLRGQFFLAQAVAPEMLKTGGVIINIIDIYAERPLAKYAPYTASKGGLLTLTKTLAKEWAPKIRVNAVSPGAVLLPDWYSEEQKKRCTETNLLGRLGCAQDISDAVLFLLRNEYITGFNLKVDGGNSLL